MGERAMLHPVQSTVIALPPRYVGADSRATPVPLAASSTPFAAEEIAVGYCPRRAG